MNYRTPAISEFKLGLQFEENLSGKWVKLSIKTLHKERMIERINQGKIRVEDH